MIEFDHLSSLKDKEQWILKKLCDNSIPQPKKEKLEQELLETRVEIKKLR